jgi:amino acid permease
MDTLDKLESLNGAFACIPIAFTLPALFHLKLIAKTVKEKIFDIILVIFTIMIQIVCTIITFLYWND